MKYNQYNFTPQQQAKMVSETERVIRYQSEIRSFLFWFLESTQHKEIPAHHEAFVHLLMKIYFNLDAILVLLPGLKKDARQKISVNLLYRSISDDVINLYYLLGTVTKGSPEQSSLKNELDILHKEFLMSVEEIIPAEAEIQNYPYLFQKEQNPYPKRIEQELSLMREQNPQVYDGATQKYKKNGLIRESSHADLKPLLQTTDSAPFLSERQKVKFIKARGFSRTEMFTFLFKYFSQYQHYSPKTHELTVSDAILDLKCYRWCIMEVLNAIGEANWRFGMENLDEVDRKLKELLAAVLKWG